MIKISFMKVLSLSPLLLVLNSCMIPGTATNSSVWSNGGFPSSTTETHTRTTIVTPPSYATVNIPPPMISQGQPVVQQPMMYQSQTPMQSSQCAPNYQQPVNQDPCNYQVQVPQTAPQRYTIAIPPAPAPSYTIALPQGNPPQYAVVQQQAPVQASMPIKLQAVNPDHCE